MNIFTEIRSWTVWFQLPLFLVIDKLCVIVPFLHSFIVLRIIFISFLKIKTWLPFFILNFILCMYSYLPWCPFHLKFGFFFFSYSFSGFDFWYFLCMDFFFNFLLFISCLLFQFIFHFSSFSISIHFPFSILYFSFRSRCIGFDLRFVRFSKRNWQWQRHFISRGDYFRMFRIYTN